MRILIDTTPLLKDLSGIGHVTYQYAKELQRIEPNTLFYYAWFYSNTLRERPLGHYERVVTLAKKYLPRPYILTHSLKTALFNYTLLRQRPDIFIQPNYISFPTFFNTKTITFIHDLSHIRYREFHPKDRVDYFEKNLQRSIQASAKIVTISHFTKQELIDLGLCEEEKIEVIPNGIDRDLRPLAMDEFMHHAARFEVEHRGYFLFVGTLEPRKNLETLLKSYLLYLSKVQKPTPLILAGGVGWRSEHFDDILQKALSTGWVKRVGYVSQKELIALYAGAKAFLFPSYYEGFGLPPLEAMACATPVIASRSSSIPEVLGDSAILIEPKDVESFANALERMDEDRALRTIMAKKGLKRAKLFSWEKSAKKLYELAKHVAKS